MSDELVRRLRAAYKIDEEVASDEELLAATKGHLTRASIEFNMAAEKLGRSIVDAWRPVFERLGRFR